MNQIDFFELLYRTQQKLSFITVYTQAIYKSSWRGFWPTVYQQVYFWKFSHISNKLEV